MQLLVISIWSRFIILAPSSELRRRGAQEIDFPFLSRSRAANRTRVHSKARLTVSTVYLCASGVWLQDAHALRFGNRLAGLRRLRRRRYSDNNCEPQFLDRKRESPRFFFSVERLDTMACTTTYCTVSVMGRECARCLPCAAHLPCPDACIRT